MRNWIPSAFVILLAVLAVLTTGCGKQSEQITAPRGLGGATSQSHASRIAQDVGPRICFFNDSFNYCYPTGGYVVDPSAEIPLEISESRAVTMGWYAEPEPGRAIHSYRWAVDIADVFDDTPRADEETDLAHWSRPSTDPGSAELGPWTIGEQHRLYVEATDDFGFKSLGIVRFQVVANRPPDCSAAEAIPAVLWPANRRFVEIGISGVTDPDGDPLTITVTSVSQDEPVQDSDATEDRAIASLTPAGSQFAGGWGRPDGCADARIESDGTLLLRAERSRGGDGRVYLISFTAVDAAGAACQGSVRVCVPVGVRDPQCTDGGQIFDALECTPPE